MWNWDKVSLDRNGSGKSLEGINLTSDQRERMLAIFKSGKIMLSSKLDKVVWCGLKSGAYSVKLGYQILDNREVNEDRSMRLCWGNACLPKAGAFA